MATSQFFEKMLPLFVGENNTPPSQDQKQLLNQALIYLVDLE
jgi:hypothetical protein